MNAKDNLPILTFGSQQAWEVWLAEQHHLSPGAWLKIGKKGAEVPTVSYAEALEIALCYGWIDGQKAAFDDAFWLQRFTPRKAGSKWSRINRDKATELIAAGRMKPAGLQQIEAAQADGRWEAAYDSQRTATVPDDLQAALEQEPEALAFFATLDRANRYAILYRIAEAKQPATRARRIEKFVAMLRNQEKIHP